eukprot:TRINITY_DN88972_c0_g1_i1.p1 TRINITY_DN88972_c0_g1~~TRINITY_DN88972_c0_g1_i1.p1  ORF type:complete len:293 (-),score=8.85 TRINITY_DN88972_c0_g1_i1:12-833(-)
MEQWYLKDSSLYYGLNQSETDQYILLQTFANSYKLPSSPEDTVLPLNLRVSKNGKYCAAFSEGHYWADFYGLTPREFTNPKLKSLVEKGLLPTYRPKYLFTLKRNTYYTAGTQFLLEFSEYKDKISGELQTCFLFNTSHGKLDVYDMNGKIIVNRNYKDIFFTQYWLTDSKEEMVAEVWFWHPIEGVAYYDIKRLFEDPTYKGTTVEADEGVFFDSWIDRAKCVYKLTDKAIFCKDVCISETEEFDNAFPIKDDNYCQLLCLFMRTLSVKIRV